MVLPDPYKITMHNAFCLSISSMRKSTSSCGFGSVSWHFGRFSDFCGNFCKADLLIFFKIFFHEIFISRLIFTMRARKQIIYRKLRLSPKRNRLNVDVNLITDCLDYGDWKLVYHILRNMNSETFAEFCEHLTELLRDELVSRTKYFTSRASCFQFLFCTHRIRLTAAWN